MLTFLGCFFTIFGCFFTVFSCLLRFISIFLLLQGTSVIAPIFPLLLVLVPGVYIAVNSEELLYENNPILYNLVFGLIGSKITNKLIVSLYKANGQTNIDIIFFTQVAQMTKSELDIFDSVFLAPLALFLNQFFGTTFSEAKILWLCWVRQFKKILL